MSEFNSTVADYSALLNEFVYLDVQDVNYNDLTLQEILDNMKTYNPKNVVEKKEYALLVEACKKNPELGELRLVNQSHVDYQNNFEYSGEACTDDPIQACAFQSGNGDLYVAYRGTGDRRWGDNGQGFVDASTDMQNYASDYFDYVVDECGYAKNLYVTGHSKGGNEAQYVTLTSKHRYEITSCYSFDGQGFSKEAIKNFKADTEYETLLNKMYSINGDNDPVHNLIGVVIPNDNTYYTNINYKDLNGKFQFGYCHDLMGMLTPDGVNWQKDEDGNITHGQEGTLSRASKAINGVITTLPTATQGSIAIAVMEIIDMFTGGSMDDASAAPSDYITLIEIGIPAILFAIGTFSIAEIYDNYGAIGAFASTAVLAGMTILLKDVLLVVVGAVALVDIVLHVADSVIKLVEEVKEMALNVAAWFYDGLNAIVSFMKGIQEWLYKNSASYKYASANPYIEINTSTMRTYATQLKSLSARAKSLDRRMNSLYWQLGIDWSMIANLGKLLKAEVILDFAYRLDKCVNYLESTATDFEVAEKDIMGIC